MYGSGVDEIGGVPGGLGVVVWLGEKIMDCVCGGICVGVGCVINGAGCGKGI